LANSEVYMNNLAPEIPSEIWCLLVISSFEPPLMKRKKLQTYVQ